MMGPQTAVAQYIRSEPEKIYLALHRVMIYLTIYLSLSEKKKCTDIMDMDITTGTAGNGLPADMAAVALVSAGAESGT